MKIWLTHIFLVAPFIHLTSGQSLADIPACANTAALSSISSTGCDITNYACICRDSSFINSLLPLVEKACDVADLQKTIAFAQKFCASVSVTLSLSSSTSTPSAIITVSAGVSTISANISSGSVNSTVVTPTTSSSASISNVAQTANAATNTIFTDLVGASPFIVAISLVGGLICVL